MQHETHKLIIRINWINVNHNSITALEWSVIDNWGGGGGGGLYRILISPSASAVVRNI